jgi:hypothetical protein
MARIDVNHQTIRLAKGSHKPTEGRGCFVEVAGLLHTGRWTGDAPDCFCPALMAFGRKFNDWLRDDERHVLWPFTLRMGGTADDGRLRERGIRFADLAVREVAPLALEARGRAAYAAHCVAYAAADAADAAAAYAAAAAADAAYAAAAYAAAAYAAAAYAAAAAAFADRQRAIDLCLAVLDELCPSAPCAQDAELLNWAALQSLVRA